MAGWDEYSGTAFSAVLRKQIVSTGSEVAQKLSAQGVTRSPFFRLGVMPFLQHFSWYLPGVWRKEQ